MYTFYLFNFVYYTEIIYFGIEGGSTQNRHQTEPPLPIKLYNVFDWANNDQPSTNNSIGVPQGASDRYYLTPNY